MRKIKDVTLKNGKNLKEVLELHKKWLEEEGGKKADLSCEDLSYVDFSNSDLRCIILRGANLEGTNLNYANLRGAYLRDANLEGVYLESSNLTHTDLIGANLSGAYLRGANLSYTNLTGANLEGTNLRNTNLTGANLRVTSLRGADLREANLIGINLKGANLACVDLRGANLTKANLIGADLTNVKYNNMTASFTLQCPEEGSFIGYKKADNKIVKLLITEDAKRSSATTNKCRCNKAKVLSITSLDGKEEYTKVVSDYDFDFIYEVGKVVEVDDYDNNRWNECSTGIHFFITRDEAVMY